MKNHIDLYKSRKQWYDADLKRYQQNILTNGDYYLRKRCNKKGPKAHLWQVQRILGVNNIF